MSKRAPTARQDSAPKAPSPRRFGLKDIRIRSKLALILLVPVVAITALAAVELVRNGRSAFAASEAKSLAEVSSASAAVNHDLQAERTAAVAWLGGLAGGEQKFNEAVSQTKSDVRKYTAKREALSNIPSAVRPQLDQVTTDLDDLKGLRKDVESGRNTTTAVTMFRYRVPIADIIGFRDAVSHLVTDPGLQDSLRASVSLSEAKEYVALEQAVVLRSLALGQYEPIQGESFTSTVTGYDNAVQNFNQVASSSLSLEFGRKVSGTDVAAAQKLETAVADTQTGTKLEISADDWYKAMDGRLDQLRKVEALSDGSAWATARAQSNALNLQLAVQSALILLALVLGLLFALVVARGMARSLRQLREGALRVAYEGLPEAVATLRESDVAETLSPDDIANQVNDPVQVRGRDEIGQVSEAFNVVHREAVRTAAEQAVLRNSVATMFVNLARRSQLLVDRLIGHLDKLEQGEEDPDRLAQLFQLDHLATRMRRNDENLLVLAGADSSRARREAAPLGDVLRAAQSEVEQYTRIEFGVVDRDVEVEATAVNDMVHLVAELLDNATSFSSPDTAVVVDARRVGDRAIVQIEDRGIGMSPEVLAEVNDRLARPPLVDVAVSRMMGLVVVGRLASRLGVRIELRPAPDRGLVADVTLPGTILIPMQRGARTHSTQPTPLALEPSVERTEAPRPRGGDGMPGVPFRPVARDTLADAATGHGGAGAGGTGYGTTNGHQATPSRSSGLPQRSPSLPPGEQRPDEPPRRSLFEPVRRPSDEEEPPPPGSPFAPTGEPSRGADADATAVFERPDFDSPPPAADPSLPQRRGEFATPSAGDVWNTSGASGDTAGGGLPRREPAPAPGDRSASSGWPTIPAGSRSGFDDLTVETPQVAPPANVDRSTGDDHGAGRIDSRQPDSAPDSGSSRSEIIPRNVDDTMELPIFREVESAWFRTSPSSPRTASATGAQSAPAATASGAAAEARPTGGTGAAGSPPASTSSGLPIRQPLQRASRPEPPAAARADESPRSAQPVTPPQPLARPVEQPAAPPVEQSPRPVARPDAPAPQQSAPVAGTGRPAEVPSEGRPDIDPWQTAADEGWQAASALADTGSGNMETTTSGLPKRRPMAQLVPGGIEEPRQAVKTRERSPEAVRGLLSAYHRGVQRGRSGGTSRVSSVSGYRSTEHGAGEEREA